MAIGGLAGSFIGGSVADAVYEPVSDYVYKPIGQTFGGNPESWGAAPSQGSWGEEPNKLLEVQARQGKTIEKTMEMGPKSWLHICA
jgi:hypothetical protein